LATIRVAAFVDGFNLYHALRDMGRDHLKLRDVAAELLQAAPRIRESAPSERREGRHGPVQGKGPPMLSLQGGIDAKV
jgi:hypothetical protein